MKTKTTLILGGPGAGKTTRLLDILDKEMTNGIPAHMIAYVSFTRKAVNEAKSRAIKRFGLHDKNFPFFRTIHSLCYRQIGARPQMVLSRTDLKRIGQTLGIPITGHSGPDEDESMSIGDRMISIDNFARSTYRSLEDSWHELGSDIPWFQLVQLVDTLNEYKRNRGLIDFTDMVTRFADEGTFVGVEIAIIDEAQDLTPSQWRAVDKAFSKCKRVYIAGDDDQAIYAWSGADIERFLGIIPDKKEILPKSHRLPREIYSFSRLLLERIDHRHPKDLAPRNESGKVEYISCPADVDMTEGSWYLLARNRCFLKSFEAECYAQGVPYTTRSGPSVDPDDVNAIRIYESARKGNMMNAKQASILAPRLGVDRRFEEGRMFRLSDLVSSTPGIWHDHFDGLPPSRVAYYLTILRRGGSMTKPAAVHIDTIHGVKGGEADNVVLMTDQTSRTALGAMTKPDDEARVFYVGATRAKKNLYIMNAQTETSYRI